MTDVKFNTEEPSRINWKNKLFKMVPYTGSDGNEVKDNPPFSNKGGIIGDQTSISSQILKYVKKNQHRQAKK